MRIFLAVLVAAMRETGAQRPGAGVRAGCPLPWPASPPAAGAWPPGRTRPSAARTVNVETPVAAAICRSVCPAASSPAIRAASAGVSFDALFGPRRTGTSPATPPQASAWSHRQMVAGSTPNASATWPCDAARSRTSCTAASRRPASSPASQAKAASPCTATSPPSSPASRPTPAAISAAPADSSGRGSWLSIRAIIHHPAQGFAKVGVTVSG